MKRLLLAIALVALLSCRTMSPERGFLFRTTRVNGAASTSMVYVPQDWTPTKSWPVILFLHGAGERGTDGLRATQIGIGAAIRSAPERVPAVVVFPQAPPDSRWIGAPADAAMQALDDAIREWNGDPSRVYLTGLSMGGYGAWHLALAHPDRFAALLVVCGGLFPHETTTSVRRSPLLPDEGDAYAFVAERLKSMPIRIYHGTDDAVIPVAESRAMAQALRDADARDAHYAELPGVGHNAWDAAYGDSAMWRWLFRQRKR